MAMAALPPNEHTLVDRIDEAAAAARRFVAEARAAVLARVSMNGRIDRVRVDAEQHVVHGLGWYAS